MAAFPRRRRSTPKPGVAQRTPGQRSRGWGSPHVNAEGVQPQSSGWRAPPRVNVPAYPPHPEGVQPHGRFGKHKHCPRAADNCRTPSGCRGAAVRYPGCAANPGLWGRTASRLGAAAFQRRRRLTPKPGGRGGRPRVNVPAVGGRRMSTPKAFNPKARGSRPTPGQRPRVPRTPKGCNPTAEFGKHKHLPPRAENCRTPSGCQARRFDTRGALRNPGLWG